jgi:hypothetical protein
LKLLRDRQWMSAAVARLQAITPSRTARPKAVYIIRLNGLYKIGKSVRPEQRIKGMQLPGRPDLTFVAWMKDADEMEVMLHEWFEMERRHGEWFELSDEQLMQAIDRIKIRVEAEQELP